MITNHFFLITLSLNSSSPIHLLSSVHCKKLKIDTDFFFFQEKQIFGEGNPYKVIVVDCGIKQNMIRHLVMVCKVTEWYGLCSGLPQKCLILNTSVPSQTIGSKFIP